MTPVTLFLGVFFLLPLLIIALFSVLTPGLYGGVEWAFYHWNYGRIFGWADGIIEVYEPIYLQILLRSPRLCRADGFADVCFCATRWRSGSADCQTAGGCCFCS